MRETIKLIEQIKELVKVRCDVVITADSDMLEISITAKIKRKYYRLARKFTYNEVYSARDINAFQTYVIEDMCYQFNCGYTASGT